MSMDNKNVVITSAVRTAIGTFRGSLKDMQASDLGALVAKAAMKKSNLNSNDVDEIIMASFEKNSIVFLLIIFFVSFVAGQFIDKISEIENKL